MNSLHIDAIKTYNNSASLTKQIVTILAYFDVFNHPLTLKEIINLCDDKNASIYSDELQLLIDNQSCYNFKEYYSLQENIETLVNDRLEKEHAAKKYIKHLPFFVKLISLFPYVRGIAVSGSLSKGVMYKDGDIDYFIITAPNRLWITRTSLVLFKKMFLLNSKKYFCVNYFVDENNLKIIDENMFTAVEISYLLPVFNEDLVNKMKDENSWAKNIFPNFNHPLNLNFNTKRVKTTKGLELVLNSSVGEKLDKWLMKLTLKRWQKKFNHFDEETFELAMRSKRGVSKHHPQNFQDNVLNELEKRVSQIQF